MPPTATSLNCPSCGAPITPKIGEMIIKCDYCGSSITPSSGGRFNIVKLPPISSRPAVKVSLIAVFTAISLGTNFAMIDIPNVKLMDAFVFIAAFLFGLEVGLGSAVSVWAVYGFTSPYGVDDFVTLSFLITGECLYALSGWALNRANIGKDLFKPGSHHLTRIGTVFGLVGLQATFAYDVLTNFGTYFLRTSSAYQALLVGMITGAPFAILHEGSNLIFFATVVPLAIASFRRSGLTIENQLK